MTTSRDILVISPTPSHPQNSGNRKRVYNLFKYLQSKSFKIHYVLYNIYGDYAYCNKSSYDAMNQDWDYFDFVIPSIDNHRFFSYWRNLILKSYYYRKLSTRGISLPIQFGIDDWCTDALINFVKWKCQNFNFSAVFVEYVFLSEVIKCIPNNILKIIDTHDVFANRHRFLIKNRMEASFFSTSLKEEIKGLNRANLVLAIQQEEREYFEKYVKAQVMEVSHIEEEKFINKVYSNLNSVGIIASHNAINFASVKKFLNLISQKQSLSSLKIYIAGSISKSISIPVTLSNVVILNYVDSLDYFYSLADMYINPMFSGTGIKIKTLEAFSYGVPFMTTISGSIGTGSKFDFHNFKSLEDLIDYLELIYIEKKSLKSYQEASQESFYYYQTRLNYQLNSLLSRIEIA